MRLSPKRGQQLSRTGVSYSVAHHRLGHIRAGDHIAAACLNKVPVPERDVVDFACWLYRRHRGPSHGKRSGHDRGDSQTHPKPCGLHTRALRLTYRNVSIWAVALVTSISIIAHARHGRRTSHTRHETNKNECRYPPHTSRATSTTRASLAISIASLTAACSVA